MPSLAEIQRFAEEPGAFLPEPAPPARRVRTPSFLLFLSPAAAIALVSEIRTTADALDETIEEAHQLVKVSGFTRSTWIVGPSCVPNALASLLRERGFPPSAPPGEPTLTAMTLTGPPPPMPDGVEVRLVTDLGDYLLTFRLAHEAFGVPEDQAAEGLAAAPELWKHHDPQKRLSHLVLVDREPVGFSHTFVGTIGLVLGGSGVLEKARGRGAYRALIAARWAEAANLGKPALVVQAGPMSGPILERCGFRPVCKLDLVDDPLFAPGAR
jgi:hypothetical protein